MFEQLTIFIPKLVIAYTFLITFLYGMGIPIFENHKNFIKRPEILMIAGFFFLKNNFNSNGYIAFFTMFIFYWSTLMYYKNNESQYSILFGPNLGPIFKKGVDSMDNLPLPNFNKSFAEFFDFIDDKIDNIENLFNQVEDTVDIDIVEKKISNLI